MNKAVNQRNKTVSQRLHSKAQTNMPTPPHDPAPSLHFVWIQTKLSSVLASVYLTVGVVQPAAEHRESTDGDAKE